MTRRITKVSYDGEEMHIEHIIQREGYSDTYKMTSEDAPTQSFIDALQTLKTLIPQWGDMTTEQTQNCEIRGAFFSWKRDVFGGGFTALRPLKNCASPMVLNMPHKPSMPYSDGGDEGMCLTTIENELLLAVCAEAEKYLDGERAQMELPLEPGTVEITGCGKTVTLTKDAIKNAADRHDYGNGG